MSGEQMTFDDTQEADFLGASEPFTDPALWCFETKTPDAIANAACARCGNKPATLNPLPPGWGWDTMEPTNNWLWCPHWHLEHGCEGKTS